MPKDKKETKKDNTKHPICACASFLVNNMNDFNKQYWNRNATRKGVPLEQIVAQYLIQDFGLTEVTIDQLYADKK